MIFLDDVIEILGVVKGAQEMVVMLRNYNDVKSIAEKISEVLISNGIKM